MWLRLCGFLVAIGSTVALRGQRPSASKSVESAQAQVAFNPLNYECNYLPADTDENLQDYAHFFEAFSGKSVHFAGDSMLLQFWHAMRCAALRLGYNYTFGNGHTLIKPNRVALPMDVDHTALEMDGEVLFSIWNLTGLGEKALPLESLFPAPHDFFVINMGHYVYGRPSAFATRANELLWWLKKRAHDTASRPRVVLMDHPPQHFNTENGNYLIEGRAGSGSHDCSCTQPHFDQQYTKINNEFAASLARMYGFDTVALWDDMNLCNEHPFDCTHFTMSPSIFKPVMQSLAKAFAR